MNMSNSSQPRCENRGNVKRKHAEIECMDNDAAAKETKRVSCAEHKENALRKGRRACNECRQQKVRLLYLYFNPLLERILSFGYLRSALI